MQPQDARSPSLEFGECFTIEKPRASRTRTLSQQVIDLDREVRTAEPGEDAVYHIVICEGISLELAVLVHGEVYLDPVDTRRNDGGECLVYPPGLLDWRVPAD